MKLLSKEPLPNFLKKLEKAREWKGREERNLMVKVEYCRVALGNQTFHIR